MPRLQRIQKVERRSANRSAASSTGSDVRPKSAQHKHRPSHEDPAESKNETAWSPARTTPPSTDTGRGLNRVRPKLDRRVRKRRARLHELRHGTLTDRAAPELPTATEPDDVRRSSAGEADLTTTPSLDALSPTVATAAVTVPPKAIPSLSSSINTAPTGTAPSQPECVPDFQIDSDVAGRYVVLDLPQPEPEKYSAWFRRVVVRNRWMTWFTAFYVHWLGLLVTALLIVHGPTETANLLLNATLADEVEPAPPKFEVVVDVPEPQVEPSSAEAEQQPAPESNKLPEPDVQLNDRILDQLAPSAATDSSPSIPAAKPTQVVIGNPMRSPHVMTPANAVSEGSFSVWTEPAHPVAGEPYRIVIQIRLPDDLRHYNVQDLEGVVVGSDGYRKPIPGAIRGDLPIDDGYVRLVVPIVSADEKVCDTVLIRSRQLKESQKLVLQF